MKCCNKQKYTLSENCDHYDLMELKAQVHLTLHAKMAMRARFTRVPFKPSLIKYELYMNVYNFEFYFQLCRFLYKSDLRISTAEQHILEFLEIKTLSNLEKYSTLFHIIPHYSKLLVR